MYNVFRARAFILKKSEPEILVWGFNLIILSLGLHGFSDNKSIIRSYRPVEFACIDNRVTGEFPLGEMVPIAGQYSQYTIVPNYHRDSKWSAVLLAVLKFYLRIIGRKIVKLCSNCTRPCYQSSGTKDFKVVCASFQD